MDSFLGVVGRLLGELVAEVLLRWVLFSVGRVVLRLGTLGRYSRGHWLDDGWESALVCAVGLCVLIGALVCVFKVIG
ncbi:hypothetical protein [Metapseudomonas otitidis]|uniref:hypothetical protein n=1 Tax=Metapseudomonas otitidis TaxID=319939 RepID=UPI0013F63278|nr:hypothetical protein [Pseudomonas otitidis]